MDRSAQTEGYMGRCTAFICAGFRQHRKSAGAVWYGDEQSIFQTFLSYGRRILWKYGDSSGSNGRKGKIYLDKAMFGDTKDTHLSPTGTMTVKNGKHYNTYSAAFRKYIGRHELLNLKSCNGMPLAVLTLMSGSEL